uniref:Uncharacterized protein n=1 Tax=Gasterosteus aculeatus aculeatus TaxID=481459 RepID=A0AAQ4RND6_GASAC
KVRNRLSLAFVKVNYSDNSQISLFPACRRMVTTSSMAGSLFWASGTYGPDTVRVCMLEDCNMACNLFMFHTNSYRPTSNMESDEIWNSDKDKGMNIYIII